MIRTAETSDLAAITAIYAHAVLYGTGTFETDPPDLGEMTARHARIVAKGYPYLVAEIDNAVVGYAYVFAYRDRPAYRYTVEDSVYVAPDAQGKGIGAALLDALLTASQAKGFRQMVAVIGDAANHGSIRLHARVGFTHAGVLHAAGWKADRWLDVVLMQRPLGAGDTTPGAPV